MARCHKPSLTATDTSEIRVCVNTCYRIKHDHPLTLFYNIRTFTNIGSEDYVLRGQPTCITFSIRLSDIFKKPFPLLKILLQGCRSNIFIIHHLSKPKKKNEINICVGSDSSDQNVPHTEALGVSAQEVRTTH